MSGSILTIKSDCEMNAETLAEVLLAVNSTLDDLPIEPKKPGDLHQGKEHIQPRLAMGATKIYQCCLHRQNTRTVQKDNTLQLNNLICHLAPEGDKSPDKVDGLTYTDERVIFRNPEDGKMWDYRVWDKEQKSSADISTEDVISGKVKSPKESLEIMAP